MSFLSHLLGLELDWVDRMTKPEWKKGLKKRIEEKTNKDIMEKEKISGNETRIWARIWQEKLFEVNGDTRS